jgi:AraC-like DNA-binding protein
MRVFNDITEYNQYLNLKTPLHPLMDSRVCKEAIPNFPKSSKEIQVNFYRISLKKNFTGDIKYGKNKYNVDNGLLLFTEPSQIVSWDTLTFWNGYSFIFHPNLVKKHPVANLIKQYKYFSYEINDALFFTSEEEETITWLFTKIHQELVAHKSNANTDIILSLLSAILAYADIFYQRQFRESAMQAIPVTSKVKALLQQHYNDLSRPVKHIPTVTSIAQELHLSPNYLTDLIREETGKSTINLIHEFIIEQAEILLLQTDMNVGNVAHNLGFDNAPYFSRLFKKTIGSTPNQIRKQGKV